MQIYCIHLSVIFETNTMALREQTADSLPTVSQDACKSRLAPDCTGHLPKFPCAIGRANNLGTDLQTTAYNSAMAKLFA